MSKSKCEKRNVGSITQLEHKANDGVDYDN